MSPTERARSDAGKKARPFIGFWDMNPEVREFVASLLSTHSHEEIQALIHERYGEGLVPSQSAISRLRMGIAKGRWPGSTKYEGSRT